MIGGSAGEDPLIGSLDMGMGADDRTDPPIQVPAERRLFRRGLGMKVDDDQRRLFTEPGQLPVRGPEGALQVVHEDPPLQVENPDLHPSGGLHQDAAPRRRALRVVGRPDDPLLPVEVGIRFPLVPDVVAAGDHVDTQIEQLAGGLLGDAEAACQIFAIGNDQIGGMAVHQAVQFAGNRLAAGLPHKVAHEENLNGHNPRPAFPG